MTDVDRTAASLHASGAERPAGGARAPAEPGIDPIYLAAIGPFHGYMRRAPNATEDERLIASDAFMQGFRAGGRYALRTSQVLVEPRYADAMVITAAFLKDPVNHDLKDPNGWWCKCGSQHDWDVGACPTGGAPSTAEQAVGALADQPLRMSPEEAIRRVRGVEG